MAVAKKTFKKGDIVQLKSGGPKMTVSREATDSGYVVCAWFKGASLEHGNFDVDTLVLLTESAAE